MSTDDNDGAAVLLTLLLMPLSIVWKGFVLTKLWAWFVVPLGLPEIGIANAYGICLLLVLFTVTKKPDSENVTMERFASSAFFALFLPLATWGLGAAVHAFM